MKIHALPTAAPKPESAEKKASISDRLILHLRNEICLIPFSDIEHLSADGNYTLVYLKTGKKIMASRHLGHFAEKLDNRFLRTHKSHIVNIESIRRICKHPRPSVDLEITKCIPISRSQKKVVFDLVNE